MPRKKPAKAAPRRRGKSYTTPHRKKAFLSAFRELGNVRAAAEAAGIDRSTHYAWLDDSEYSDAFEAASEDAVDALEAEARRRAFEGSDTLLIFMLKGWRPHVYRERFSVSGPDLGPLPVTLRKEY